jgi:hypothetical protein
MEISQELGLGEESILVAGRPFDHPCRDADGNGVWRDVMSHETEGTDNRVFAYSDVRHDNTVAANLAVLFHDHLYPFSGSCRGTINNFQNLPTSKAIHAHAKTQRRQGNG